MVQITSCFSTPERKRVTEFKEYSYYKNSDKLTNCTQFEIGESERETIYLYDLQSDYILNS